MLLLAQGSAPTETRLVRNGFSLLRQQCDVGGAANIRHRTQTALESVEGVFKRAVSLLQQIRIALQSLQA